MLKVVIVEDEYMAQTGLGHLIEKINPEYHIAGYADNGCDGMVLVKEVKPDIVITDIKMPRMNGLEMIESLRKIHMDCLFVILSGYAEFSYAQQGISLGVTDYLLKPVTVQKIKDLMERLEKKLKPACRETKKEAAVYSLLVTKVIGYIHEHYQDKLTLDDLAEKYKVTPEYLSRMFSREVGRPFVNYLKEYRIGKAKEMLQKGNRKIYEIAFEAGYSDVKYFCRVFKEGTGVSPKKYLQYGENGDKTA